MERRKFIKQSVIAGGLSVSGSFIAQKALAGTNNANPQVLASNSTTLSTNIILSRLSKPVKLMQISDSHISCDNESDQEYQQYSARMGNAYKVTRNPMTGKETNPMECFQELMTLAKKEKPDLLVLSGDIINYPSATAVSFVLNEVKATGLPFVYTAGNHDWHYEGMAGSSDSLRKTWIENRLKPLYSGRNPFCFNEITGGINVVVIDNSTYQISEEQLNFFIAQKRKKEPIALFVHIPIYMPSMTIASCGHPKWGKEADKGYQVERREPWPEAGNSKPTLQFLKEVFDSNNLIGIFSGHWHNNHSITYKGITQNIVYPALSGHYRMINITPENQV